MRYSDIPRGLRQKRGLTAFKAGVLALVLIGVLSYFGFSKVNPFSNRFELNAIVDQANRLTERSPVRIAGVNVGKVTGVEQLGDDSGLVRIEMELDGSALPVHKSAQVRVRSRLFLEGNYFVEIRPGRPGEPVLEDGATIPANQTTGPVQFSQVLGALQSETRADLQRLLKEYSGALRGRGARGFNQALRHWEEAYRTTSQVNDATLGTRAHDLTRVLRGQSRVFGALSSNEEALKSLVTDLADTLSGFAREENNLRAAIPELRDVVREGRPALASLNSALPSIRAFARDALPGVRSSNATLDAQLPFVTQLRRLVSRAELRGLSEQLVATVPALTRLNTRTRRTLAQNRSLASCQNNVLLPFAKTPIPDPDFDYHSGEPWFEEAGRAFVGLAGESRIADANGPLFRVQAGGGPTTIVSSGETLEGPLYGQALLPIDGVRPVRPTERPVFRPNVPCETQEPPNMNAASGEGDAQVTPAKAKFSAREQRARDEAYRRLNTFIRRARRGLKADDPISSPDRFKKRPR